VFLQDSIHLNDQWILVAGGRFQEYDQYAGKGVPFKANTDSNGQKFVPRAGLVYRYTDELSFYGSYTESFKPNSTIAPLSGSSTVLDGSIAPEEAKSWELGRGWICRGASPATSHCSISRNATCWWPTPKARPRSTARPAKCVPAAWNWT
jgi:outer membrane receptor for monomeric catechols